MRGRGSDCVILIEGSNMIEQDNMFQEAENPQIKLEKLKTELSEAKRELKRLPNSTNARMAVMILESKTTELKDKISKSGK